MQHCTLFILIVLIWPTTIAQLIRHEAQTTCTYIYIYSGANLFGQYITQYVYYNCTI